MKSNSTHEINQIIDMLDSITERIDDIEKLLISKQSKVEDWTTAGLTEEEKYAREAEACSTQQPYDKYKKRLSDAEMGSDYKTSYNIENKEEYKRWRDSWIKEVDKMKKEETSKSEDDFWTKVTNGMKNLLKSPWEK